MHKTIRFVLKHKFISGIVLLLIFGGAYFGYKGLISEDSAVRYMTAALEKGTLVSFISGSGQVSSSDQVDIKPKVSGEVIYVGVKKGQEVKAGALLIQINTADAQKAVRDAEISLETANLNLIRLTEPPDELDLLKAENNLSQARESKKDAEGKIVEGYEDAFNDVSDIFLNLPSMTTGLNDVLYSYGIGKSEPDISDYQQNKNVLINSVLLVDYDKRDESGELIDDAEDSYAVARKQYEANFKYYKDASRYSEQEIIDVLLAETLKTARMISDAIKSQNNVLDYWVDYRSQRSLEVYSKITAYQSSLSSYTSKNNSNLSTILSAQRSIEDNEKAVVNAQRSIDELELSFADLEAGADELDIREREIAIQQKEDALSDARKSLSDHYVRAPFAGVIAEVNVKKGDSVSSNAVASLITKQKIAEISLNEIDVALVKIGQKASLTFDAVSDLSITGEVAEVAMLGTVSSGVVSYDVKIAFDVQDERIKPGMSVSVNIITEFKPNVLLAPLSAIKIIEESSYVQVLVDGQPQNKAVAVGSSNDTTIEIVEGLEEGEAIVTQTINNGSSISGTVQTQGSERNVRSSMGGMMMMR